MPLTEIVTFATVAKILLAARKLATDTDLATGTEALADLAQNTAALDTALRKSNLASVAAEMERRAQAMDRAITHEGPALTDARAIFWQVAPHALADPRHLTGAALDAHAATDAMVRAINASPMARDFRATAFAETYFRKVMTATLETMMANKAAIDAMSAALWRQALENQGSQIQALTRLEAKEDAQTASLDSLTKRIADLQGQLATMQSALDARSAGVTEKALFALVRPIAEHVDDRDEALLALKEAVDIAARVQAEGRHGSNLGDFVDDVLSRVTGLSAEGAYTAAISELDEALEREEAESQARTLRLLNAAIDQHLLAFDADGAAAKIARRVALETPDHAARFVALRAEQELWYERGRDKGLRLDLEVSIALARITRDYAQDADQRGEALNDLGAALRTLGQREAGTDRLEEAVTAYRAALEECTRDRVPLQWAMTQMNLGTALATLGEREARTDRLEAAVTAFRAALEEWTRDRVPLQWAMTQMNLGAALKTLGQREAGTDRLEEAVTAYRAALEEWTRDRVPLEWATAQMNLGNAVRTLGQREAGTDRLEEAVTAYRAALEECTRDRVPLQWAMTQMNLGTALATLGEREARTDRLGAAVTAFRAALEEWTRDRVPLQWAMTQMNLGAALKTLGQREAGTDRLEEAVTAYRAALEEWTRDRVPLEWATAQGNLCTLHLAFFDKTGDPAQFDAAQAALDGALDVFAQAGATQYLGQADRLHAEIDARRR